jgi:hypothetical protein
VDSDGLWRPFTAQPGVQYEFAITAAGYATTHIDRNLFPRSCSIVKLRTDDSPGQFTAVPGRVEYLELLGQRRLGPSGHP